MRSISNVRYRWRVDNRKRTILLILVGLGGAIVLGSLYGGLRWRIATRALYSRLESARSTLAPSKFETRELIGLPPPVQRYFRAVLTEGQPMVTAVAVEHAGAFNMSETGEQWKPFTSTQRVVTTRPGFVWDASIAVMRGVKVRVHDAYVAGDGLLYATLFGLMPLVDRHGTPEIAQGELMRFLAEAAWYPTALLPGQGVSWDAVDDRSANATLKDGSTTVTLLFRFNQAGLIESVRAEARGRTVDNVVIPTPWEGRWGNYEMRGGMLIPLRGEVAWLLPEGPRAYWRGHITTISYEFSF